MGCKGHLTSASSIATTILRILALALLCWFDLFVLLLVVDAIVKLSVVVQLVLTIDFLHLGRELDAVTWDHHLLDLIHVIVQSQMALS